MNDATQGTEDSPNGSAGSYCKDFHAAVEMIGRRWNGVILQQLLGGGRRYRSLIEDIPRITDAMLSTRLKELEAAGLIVRDLSTTTRQVQVTYTLTPVGYELAPVLEAVAAWSEEWASGHTVPKGLDPAKPEF